MNIFDSLNKSFLNQHLIMEDMLWKFPHVGQQIFKNLSNKNLVKSKEVARTWENFITNQNFYKLKVYYEIKQKEDPVGWTPLHDAAFKGIFEVFKMIIDIVEDKNPQDLLKVTPLHIAAIKGNLEICKYIIGKVEDKSLAINSKTDFNNTPLQFAQNYHYWHVVDYMKSQIEN